MTTTEQVAQAVTQVLRARLPAALEAAGLPEMPIQLMGDEEEVRTEQFPRAYVACDEFSKTGQDRIGEDAYTERRYVVEVTFAVKSQPGYRDLRAWANQVADCIIATLDAYWWLPYPDVDGGPETGLASDSNEESCQFTSLSRGTTLVRVGVVSYAYVVERQRKTSGAE